MWTKKLAAMFVAVLIVFSAASSAFAENGWDWEKGVVTVYGVAGFQTNQNNRDYFWRNHARQGARIDALRNLVETIGGVIVEKQQDTMVITCLDDNIITKTVSRGAHLVDTKFYEDGTCEVTMEIPIFGKNSAAEAIFSLAKENPKKNFPKPTAKVNLGNETYTGLIVDCRNLNIERTLTPVIKVDKDFVIYGKEFLGYNKIFDKVVNQGMAEYTTDINSQTRAGLKPLTVKAFGKDKDNIVISNEDADKILTANKKFHFLDNCAVVIVY